MSAVTPEDVANVCKLLERLRTGEMNLIPSLVPGTESRDPDGKSEGMLQRVEQLLNEWLRRQDQPLGDGGPAFPHEDSGTCAQRPGASLRDYFMAHAPAEPQQWFQPVMPPCPTIPAPYNDVPADSPVREELISWVHRGTIDYEDLTPEAAKWADVRNEAVEAADAWKSERAKQRYVQWPAAWADEMLKARQP